MKKAQVSRIKEIERLRAFLEKYGDEITNSEELVENLDKLENKFYGIFEGISEGVILVNESGEIELANQAVETQFGYSRGELKGEKIEKLIPYELKEAHESHRREYLKNPKTRTMGKNMDLYAKSKDVGVFPVDVGLSALKLRDKIAVVAIVTDISIQKDIEKKLRESESKLQEALETKDKFLSIIAHDLKNPLGSFRDVANVLSESFDELSEEDKKDFIGMMKEQSNQLFSLLENLLQWTRAQTGRVSYNPESIDLCMVAENNISLLQGQAEKKNITLSCEINEPVNANADMNMVTTVLRNLVSNAIKFTPEGGKISVAAKEKEEVVEVSVRDTGVGISLENQDKLFKEDSKFTTLGTGQEKGTGLGLILCKEFVERHGGEIWVESREGEGTTFNFTLPKAGD